MKNCAIICEYNPFHTGHKYQLDCVKQYGVDNIFCVMSGAFVQSAMPAFCDKAIRAECAVLGGANAVIELPTVFATASAQTFATGAVKIISAIKNISNIAMGAVGPRDDIMRIADIKIKYSERYSATLKGELQGGKSYNAASVAALNTIYNTIYPDKNNIDNILSDPNNILAIEYIAAISEFCASVEPIIIRRVGAKHNDTAHDGDFVSATAIRNATDQVGLESMQKFIPFNYDKILSFCSAHTPNIDLYKHIAVYALKRAELRDISSLRDCSEGMEYLLKKMSGQWNFDEYIDAAICRRYGKKRLYRLFFDLILGIDKTVINNRFCTRLLACKKNFDFNLLPASVKTNNADIKRAAALDSEVNRVLDVDINAVALYNTICRINGDYFKYSLVKA